MSLHQLLRRVQNNKDRQPVRHDYQPTNYEVSSNPVALPESDVCACEGDCPQCLSLQSAGRESLPAGIRLQYERFFGHDFSSVKIHRNAQAIWLTEHHRAKALTWGNHIFFNQGEYQPRYREGQGLLAHELSHVVQQQQAGPRLQCLKKRRDGFVQEPTLGELKGNYSGLKPYTLREMDPITFFEKLSMKERYTWYMAQLGPYQNQIDESALKHKVPPQLIATIILNELADINIIDLIQQFMGLKTGSIGMTQINVDTAIQHNLVTMPGDEAQWEAEAQSAAEQFRKDTIMMGDSMFSTLLLNKKRFKEIIKRTVVAKRLRIPQFAIEAVARELKHLLEQAVLRRGNPWQQKFGFSLTSLSELRNPNDIYQFVDGTTQLTKEWNLARMMAAAFNSPDIIRAHYKSSITVGSEGFIYRNATIHGQHAATIAGDLYIFKLFHSFSNYKRPVTPP